MKVQADSEHKRTSREVRASLADKVTPTLARHNGPLTSSNPLACHFRINRDRNRSGTASALRGSMSTKPVAHQVVPGVRGAESASAEEGAVRPRDSFFHWCGTADAIRTTTSRPEKRAILDAYFVAVAEETVAPAARFFDGKTVMS